MASLIVCLYASNINNNDDDNNNNSLYCLDVSDQQLEVKLTMFSTGFLLTGL